jgi:hypothetical protein
MKKIGSDEMKTVTFVRYVEKKEFWDSNPPLETIVAKYRNVTLKTFSAYDWRNTNLVLKRAIRWAVANNFTQFKYR